MHQKELEILRKRMCFVQYDKIGLTHFCFSVLDTKCITFNLRCTFTYFSELKITVHLKFKVIFFGSLENIIFLEEGVAWLKSDKFYGWCLLVKSVDLYKKILEYKKTLKHIYSFLIII